MNRHQVLTGAANSGDKCFAVGSVEGKHFTAYASGCNIVILASDFQRVQIIPGITHGTGEEVTCISCCSDVGKIAAAYGSKVYIFEPTPLLQNDNNSHKLDYQWYHTGSIDVDGQVLVLAWNLEGTRLLTSGPTLQMWQMPETGPAIGEMKDVKFFIEDKDNVEQSPWNCIWQCRPSNPVTIAKFSSDGLLFATAGQNDRLVKIWYEAQKLQLSLLRSDSVSPKGDQLSFNFIYIAHPRAVTGFSWRRTSKYMQKGTIANMLLTSCKDNICRIWCETVLPDDGLLDIQQLDASAFNSNFFLQSHRTKKRFIQRLQHVRHILNKRKRSSIGSVQSTNDTLSSTGSVGTHDVHKFGVHASVPPTSHFHLAASINAKTDIPLMSPLSNGQSSAGGAGACSSFIIHWLNNKEFCATLEAANIIEEMSMKTSMTADAASDGVGGAESDLNSPSAPPSKPSNGLAQIGSEPILDGGLKKSRPGLQNTKNYMSIDSEKSTVSSVAGNIFERSESIVSQDGGRGLQQQQVYGIDEWESRIERLIHDWHTGSDVLFSVHPVDGSLLMWLVEYLDEPFPASFRQAQVSFSALLPGAFPTCDATTMETNVWLYCDCDRVVPKSSSSPYESDSKRSDVVGRRSSPSSRSFRCSSDDCRRWNALRLDGQTPSVRMVTKHTNGSLNIWQMTFGDDARFATVVSVSHESRACGHRFHANSAACHPVLPLLLTTSHLSDDGGGGVVIDGCAEDDASDVSSSSVRRDDADVRRSDSCKASPSTESLHDGGFCSELILWRVAPIGPLSKSGGITELARINSTVCSAFTNVAWLPTLLPSSSVGSKSNSPSALFVASDGVCLRVYQAVLDGRFILAEQEKRKQKQVGDLYSSSSGSSSEFSREKKRSLDAIVDEKPNLLNIVSLQSTSRPGCIIELVPIADATQNWKNIQLIHVFQEQLVGCAVRSTGTYRSKVKTDGQESTVNQPNISVFEERFYLVVFEKLPDGSVVVHMWKITVASQNVSVGVDYTHDTIFLQDEEIEKDGSPKPSSLRVEPAEAPPAAIKEQPPFINTIKVCTQTLPLLFGVSITSAAVAAGHLSSSSIYPACLAPYLIVTPCTDGCVRFWCCEEGRMEEEDAEAEGSTSYLWKEWEMMIPTEDTSSIHVGGKVLAVSCAYSGRIAVAYRSGGVKTRVESPHDQFVNLCVSIYQCESTGGSEWTLEDTIQLKNIVIPDPKVDVDLSLIFDGEFDASSRTTQKSVSSTPSIVWNVPVPSTATVKSVRRHLKSGRPLSQKNDDFPPFLHLKTLVHLDWVSTEDGSHVLTIGVGSQILLYVAVSGEMASTLAGCKEPGEEGGPSRARTASSRGRLQKTKSMAVMTVAPELRWMKLRSIELETADGLAALPMHISWVRNGILVVGMDNEIHVYSQWKIPGDSGVPDVGNPGDVVAAATDGPTMSSSASFLVPRSMTLSKSISGLKLDASIANLSLLADKKDKERRKDARGSADLPKSDSFCSLRVIRECGLFEAARLANPILPQYHPKQLIELLNFGRIRRVKAILSHLLRCIAGETTSGKGSSGGGGEPAGGSGGGWHRAGLVRNLSGRTSPKSPMDGMVSLPEEAQTDYLEISSIPPLPLYALLAADDDGSFCGGTDVSSTDVNKTTNDAAAANDNYNTLFNFEPAEDTLEDPFDEAEPPTPKPTSQSDQLGGGGGSSSRMGHCPNAFSPAQASCLARHLIHTQLPGMSSLDQMYLLALAETVANTKVDFGNADVSSKNASNLDVSQNELVVPEAIDDCGLRFLLAARHHVYLMNTLPMRHRGQLQQQGLSPAYYVWAFHSDSEQELLDSLPCMQKGSPTWAELRQFGAGWWLRNVNTLTRCIEKLAKAAFAASKDPLDSALFYIAMKKKNILWGLFRSNNDTKMAQFFRNDFREDRWRKAALKNAYALLGKQKFQRAAAFFLLGSAVKDAVEVCLTKLDDLQLALVILRLYESDLEDSMPSSYRRLLFDEVLGCDADGQNLDASRASPDPFLRSMAYWILKDYSGALGTLLMLDADFGTTTTKSNRSSESVFNFYNYLRTHPLLVRQHLAITAADNSQTVLLSGFSYGSKMSAGDKNVTYVDRITPVERRLYFLTAHEHFKNGCPMLALEVLTKLPEVVNLDQDVVEARGGVAADDDIRRSFIATGTLAYVAGSASDAASGPAVVVAETASGFDWSVAPATDESAGGCDWSVPATRFPAEEEELDLGFRRRRSSSSSENGAEEEEKEKKKKSTNPFLSRGDESVVEDDSNVDRDGGKSSFGCDVMAQQLKFIACIKIIVNELATLATGFEVDGGQLRCQLYVWLEKEVEVLKKLCNYGSDVETDKTATTAEAANAEASDGFKQTSTSHQSDAASILTLHDVMLAEKSDFDAKMNRTAHRRKWLKANRQLLATLLSYGVLHGSCGGGLASMHMELLLLLQELQQQQQEKTRRQLVSPLPFPTTLPIVSASFASAKLVIADPIQHLSGMCHDLLRTIVDFRMPPNTDTMPSKVVFLQNLSTALSACIYQCLCDSDSVVLATNDNKNVGMDGFTSTNVVYKDSYLMAGAQSRLRQSSGGMTEQPTSLPVKWPGVSSLTTLMNENHDEDTPRLNVLLTESLVAVYMSLLCYALAMFDAIVVYRLVGHPLVENVWPVLFGGGLKTLVQVSTTVDVNRSSQSGDDVSRHRNKYAGVVLGPSATCQRFKEDRPTYRERFIPPQMSMVSYFMTKVKGIEHPGVDYDSAESISSQNEDEDDEEIIGANRRTDAAMNEHLNPKSYSWCLMRYAIIKYVSQYLKSFLPKIGMELSDLPTCSPLLHGIVRNMEQWEDQLKDELERFNGPPNDYIPGCYIDPSAGGINVMKYSSLMDPSNTPFVSNHYSSRPAKRLWHYLVTRDYLQDVFIRYVFKKRKSAAELEMQRCSADVSGTDVEPMKIIHKDQEVMTCFCINQVNQNCLVVATQKEVVEMDIRKVLFPPSWINDEVDYDIEVIRNSINQPDKPEEFLVVRTPYDGKLSGGSYSGGSPISSSSGGAGGGNVLLKRSVSGVKRVAAHPLLPYYLTGSQDGCVRLWEWGHPDCISEPRKPGAFPKATKVLFNEQGNKFGVSDTEGAVCLWQVGLGLSMNKPYLSLKCHSKVTSDFVFVGSSSLLATAGHSADNRNVCLWDTLLPKRKALVQGFHCHNDGCPALVYAPQHQAIICGGRKGEICIFDVRQRQLRQTFQAHDSAIKCIAVDSVEENFVTGSADGDIKVWGLAMHNLVYSFTGEHSKGSSLFRNISSGVTQVHLGAVGHLFSCGTDGSLKVHQLAHKRGIVNTWHA